MPAPRKKPIRGRPSARTKTATIKIKKGIKWFDPKTGKGDRRADR
jgi:hypothetical protein